MTKAKGFLVLGGALCLLFGVWLVVLPIMSETHGTPYCGNSKYSKFSFKNGQEFLIPDAYLDNRYGVNVGLDNHNGVVSLVVVEMHQDDGSPNCNKVRRHDSGFVRVTISPHHFETVFNTRKGHYPYRIEEQEDMFDLYRPLDTKNMMDIAGKKDFLLPKIDEWTDKLFIECAISNFSHNSGERLGCSARSKLKDNVMITYGYKHQYLHQFKEIDMTMKRIISEFIVTPEEGK